MCLSVFTKKIFEQFFKYLEQYIFANPMAITSCKTIYLDWTHPAIDGQTWMQVEFINYYATQINPFAVSA